MNNKGFIDWIAIFALFFFGCVGVTTCKVIDQKNQLTYIEQTIGQDRFDEIRREIEERDKKIIFICKPHLR